MAGHSPFIHADRPEDRSLPSLFIRHALSHYRGLIHGSDLPRIRTVIIRASAAFTKRFKCQLSLEGKRLPQERCLEAWSCHLMHLRRRPLVVMMNDATLYMIIIPATGLKGIPDLWVKMLERIAEVWRKHGAAFDPDNQSLIIFSRTNRSLIGSMNDAISVIHWLDEHARSLGEEMDLPEMEQHSNDTPYQALDFETPQSLLAKAMA